MSRIVTLAIRALIIVLALVCLLVQLVFAPTFARGAAMDPVPGAWRGTDIAFAIALFLLFTCAEVVLVVIWVLLGRAQSDRVFQMSSIRWIDWTIGAGFAATACVFVIGVLFTKAYQADGDSPGVVALGFGVPMALTLGFALVMIVMRRLLLQATQMRGELDEVI